MAKAGSLRARKRRGVKKKGAGLSLRVIGLTAIVTITLILWVAAFWTQLMPLRQLQTVRNVEVKAQTERLANKVAAKVAAYTERARAVAIDPVTRKLLQSGDSRAIHAREKELRELFPWVRRVRLLKTGIRTPDKSSEPYISYACIDLMREAESSLQAPPVEVHVFGSPQQHIDIVQPVLSATGKAALGFVQVTLNTEVFKQWLTLDDAQAYVSLTQSVENRPSLMLTEVGNANVRSQSRSAEQLIAGTRWHLTLWIPDKGDISIFNTNLLITYLVGTLMVVLLILLLWRALSRTISTDVESFMYMIAQELQGSKKHQYQLMMKEFQKAARQIDNLKSAQPMERERDEDSSSINLASLNIDDSLDPLYMNEDSMEVEEIDDAAFEKMRQQSAAAATAEAPAKSAPPPRPAAPPPPLPPAEIFKAYDIRGIVGRTLTAEHMLLIGRAIGSEAAARGLQRIAFARDGRLSGPELGQALVKGLLATGIDVVDVGMVPTPALYYAAAELTDGSGVMLTGSHNPSDYNGIKMVLGGETLSGEAIQALKQRIDNSDFVEGSGQYRTNPISNTYIERVVSDIKLKRPLKIVVDSGNGVAGGMAPKLYRSLGCEVIELYSEVDGRFPNHHPDPSQPENLRDLIEMVQSQGADVGFAFDGDGDRLGVVSADGKIIWPDRLMMLFAADVLSRNPGAQIIYDIKCSNNLTRVIWEKGGEPVMWKTGHSLIKSKMKQSGALLAGEMSGHIFFKERWYGFDDALYSGARLLEIIAADERKPAEIFASLPDAVNTPELRVEMTQSELEPFMDELLSKADFPDANIIMIDGLRADFEEGWGLIRASNTTPSLIMRFEGKDKAALASVQEKFKQLIHEINPTLRLPF